jgi:hypothetical protein
VMQNCSALLEVVVGQCLRKRFRQRIRHSIGMAPALSFHEFDIGTIIAQLAKAEIMKRHSMIS